jgi:Protein of unknown function (DUF3089)
MLLGLSGALIALTCVALLPATAGAATKWLCRPGLAENTCTPSLKTTLISPAGEIEGVRKVKPAKHPKIDCFYVYPTVSNQAGPNATRSIDPELRSIALYQAARYSRLCRVFAPVYRQVTVPALLGGGGFTPERLQIAYSDVLEAWRTYLSKYNHGRGVVLIGHSQGTFHLDKLVSEQIDPKPRLRRKLLSAILLGGNVQVAKGKKIGGDFKHIGACHSPSQVGCVMALSTFDAEVPMGAIFGRSSDPTRDVLCTNPAALGGGSAVLDSVFPSEPFAPDTIIGQATQAVGVQVPDVNTPWIELRRGYRGRCSSADAAHVLQISALGGAAVLNPVPDPTWGLHLVDANIALGNLVRVVGKETRAYLREHR